MKNLNFTTNQSIENINNRTFIQKVNDVATTVRLTEFNETGKYYYEFYIDKLQSNIAMYMALGLAPIDLNGWLGQNNSLGFWSNGACMTSGSFLIAENSAMFSKSKFKQGDIISFLLNLDDYKLTIKINNQLTVNVFENININILKANKAIIPALGLKLSNDQVTINLGTEPFKYDIPDGYSPYITIMKYLINYNKLIYSIRENYYSSATKNYVPMNIDNNSNISQVIDSEGFYLSDINKEITKDDETFKPVDKFEDYTLIMKK